MAQTTGPLDLSEYITRATQIGQDRYNKSNDQYAWAKKAYEDNKAVSDKVSQQALDIGSSFYDWAKGDRKLWEDVYVPGMREQMDFARGYTTPGRMAANRGAATAQSNISFDAAADMAKRALQGYGVDPSSGRFAGLDAGLAAKRAAGAAAAATKSDRDTEMLGQEYLARAINTGAVLPGQAANEAGVGMAAGNTALNAGLATTASGSATMGTPLQWAGLGDDMFKEWKNSMIAQTEAGQRANQMQLERDRLAQGSSSGIGAMIGGGLGLLGGVFGGPMGATIGNMAGNLFGSMAPGSGYMAAEGGLIPDDGEETLLDEDEVAMMDGDGMDVNMHVNEAMAGMPDNPHMVPPAASPTGGEATDDVPAQLTAGEFVLPKDVTSWYGEKYLQGLIEKARKEMTSRTAEPTEVDMPPEAAAAMSPTYQSAGAMGA